MENPIKHRRSRGTPFQETSMGMNQVTFFLSDSGKERPAVLVFTRGTFLF